MKLFLSLFLSVCISLSPLYSSAETLDLEPVYTAPDFDTGSYISMDQIYTADQATLDSQLLFEKMKAALSHPNLKEKLAEIFNPADMQTAKARLSHDPSLQEDILTKVKDFASAANLDIEEKEARALLNDPAFMDEQFAQIENNIANLDEEKLKDFQNTLNSESFAERQSSEQLMAQLNHNIDQMVEVDHAPGSIAMLGAGPALPAGAVLAIILGVFGITIDSVLIAFHLDEPVIAGAFFMASIFTFLYVLYSATPPLGLVFSLLALAAIVFSFSSVKTKGGIIHLLSKFGLIQ